MQRGYSTAMANNNQRVYIYSPVGTAQFAWLNKPDTKFKSIGVYKVDVALGGQEADSFKALINAEAKAALERYWETEEGKKVPAAKRAKWTTYVPYKDDEDAEGNPTGYTVFKFKQNAKIKLKDGTVKEVKVGLRDSKDKPVNKPIFSGTELRVSFMFRDILMKTDTAVGVQLAIGWAQIFKLAPPINAGQTASSPFSTPEGGWAEEEDAEVAATEGNTEAAAGGDY